MLSVIVPNYNHARFLPECLDSIAMQSFQPHEILIIDDASTDESLEIINRYCLKNPLMKLIQNEKNMGVIRSVNSALLRVQGSHLVFCAADDLLLPEFFESAYLMFQKNPEIGLCCGEAFRFLNKLPYQFRKVSLRLGERERILNPIECLQMLKKKPFWIPSHSTMYKTALVRQYGGFNAQLGPLCDWFLNYQIALRNSVGYIPRPLSAVRVLENSYGASIQRNRKVREKCFAHLFKELDADSEGMLRQAVQKSGLVGQVGIAMLFYLIKSPSRWNFLLMAVRKKIQFFIYKLLQK